ncbi:unnamed protein product [Allacma fusca]|uniref:Uncharacterized protein n=1 Tax=Allacma fusca TaxID=39272 RepID=A0A8J2KHA3_9HEXA|nr:unnamed protein product [Allacma fusca]
MANRRLKKFSPPLDIFKEISANSENLKDLDNNLLAAAYTQSTLLHWANNSKSGKSSVPLHVYYALECASILGRVAFSNKCQKKRTDKDFTNKSYPEHHVGEAILEQLNVGLVTTFPVEYQDLDCLGVMRKLLRMWCKGSRSEFKLSNSSLELISVRLVAIRLPKEFPVNPELLLN